MEDDSDNIEHFPVLSIDAVEYIAITSEEELDFWCEAQMDNGIPLFYLVGLLQNQINYLLIPEE
jgi:hypothetical protein